MMKEIFSTRSLGDKGAVVLLVAFLLIFLLGIAAFALDFGYRHLVKNELQNAADAAALAGARDLGKIYEPMSYALQQSYTLTASDKTAIVDTVQNTALTNYAGDEEDLDIAASDIFIGDWDSSTTPNFFTETSAQPDAVKVIVRRQKGYNSGPIRTLFGRIFGVETMAIEAQATAALTGQSTAGEGEVELPVGISKSWFDDHADSFCGQTVKFSPTTDPDACAGWNTFTLTPANTPKIKTILDDMTDEDTNDDDDLTNPYTDTSTLFTYTNGDIAPAFESLMLAFEDRGYDVDAIYNPENPTVIPQKITQEDDKVPLINDEGVPLQYPPCAGASGNCEGPLRYAHEWPTTVVVYDSDECNPNKPIKVKGFVNVVVYDVGEPSNLTVSARIMCDYVQPGRGGGGDFGTLGSIPNLVD